MKWEYCAVQSDFMGATLASLENKGALSSKKSAMEKLQEMGNKGWELVFVLYENYPVFIFKRPAE